jgi:hypothetical protein
MSDRSIIDAGSVYLNHQKKIKYSLTSMWGALMLRQGIEKCQNLRSLRDQRGYRALAGRLVRQLTDSTTG